MPYCLELRIVGSMKKILIYNEIITLSSITQTAKKNFIQMTNFKKILSAYNTLNAKLLKLLNIYPLNKF